MQIDPATATLTTVHPEPQVRDALVAALDGLGADVNDTGGTIHAKSGRKVGVRLVPFPVMPDGWLPVSHVITLRPGESGTTVEIVVDQAFGRGLTGVGVKSRYERVLQEHLAALASAIA